MSVLDRENNFYVVKHPAVAQEDGSIALFAEVETGDELVLMEATVDDLLNEVSRTVEAAME